MFKDFSNFKNILSSQIAPDGIETLDHKFSELFCTNPVCRGLAVDLASFYSSCGNAAPGYAGALARKVKALKEQLKACPVSKQPVVNRQQLQIEGVIDPLSRSELLDTEKFVKGEVDW